MGNRDVLHALQAPPPGASELQPARADKPLMSRASAPPEPTAASELDAAQRCLESNDHGRGIVHARAAWELAMQERAPGLAMRAATLQLMHLQRSGNDEQTVAQGQRMLASLGPAQDPGARAELLGVMALSADQLDLSGEALDYALTALDCAQRSGQPALQCLALSRLARAYTRLSKPDRGCEFARQALALAQAIGDTDQIFRAYTMLGDAQGEEALLLTDAGQTALAQERHAAALASFDSARRATLGAPSAYRDVVALINQAQALGRMGRLTESLQMLDDVVTLARTHGFARMVRAQIEMRALALIKLDRTDEARAVCESALADPQIANDAALAPELHKRLYQACKAQGDLEAALRHHERLFDLEQRRFRRRDDAQLRVLLARAEIERSRADAERAAHEAQIERERALVLRAERDRLQHKAQQLGRDAHLDVLTGLPNRRALEVRLHDLLQRATTTPTAACLAIVDIDHFKAINDRHGHMLGDEVLRAIGALLAQGFREPDFVARWGGEEFVALLHGASPAHAQAACERLRLAIAAHDWSTLAAGLAVTASIGVHALHPDDAQEHAIGGADRALYAAKRGGRNRVVLGPAP